MHGEKPTEDERAMSLETPDTAERPERPVSPLRWLADTYEQTQRLRIQLSNRIGAVQREADAGPVPRSASQSLLLIGQAERALTRDMEEALAGHPAMAWLGQVKGIGPVLATKILAHVEIDRAPTISALWRFAGYAVIDGARERPVKGGGPLHYCIRLKTACYLVCTSFVKLGARSPYREVYDHGRAVYLETRPDWTKGHQHLAAMRRTTKLFLSHLHTTWRHAVGLPIREPYAMEYLGHTHWLDPWKFIGGAEAEPEYEGADNGQRMA